MSYNGFEASIKFLLLVVLLACEHDPNIIYLGSFSTDIRAIAGPETHSTKDKLARIQTQECIVFVRAVLVEAWVLG
jgi:hypothetical protein